MEVSQDIVTIKKNQEVFARNLMNAISDLRVQFIHEIKNVVREQFPDKDSTDSAAFEYYASKTREYFPDLPFQTVEQLNAANDKLQDCTTLICIVSNSDRNLTNFSLLRTLL